MDNASKNAKDMISSLQMKYNRGRQAAITNELVDIITGTPLCSVLIFVLSHINVAQVPVLCKLVLRWKIPHRSCQSLLN
jgi:F-type H+-transporting ATPase subunit gamma